MSEEMMLTQDYKLPLNVFQLFGISRHCGVP